MVVYKVDRTGHLDVLEGYQSLIWTTQYYGPGDFEIVAPATERNRELLAVGSMLARSEDIRGKIRRVMMVESVSVRHDIDAGDLITARGCGLGRALLKRRIIWDQITQTGRIVDIIATAISDNAIRPTDPSRAIPYLILGQPITSSPATSLQVRGDNLADWVESVCRQYGYGWEVRIGSGTYVFELYEGTDHTYDGDDPVVFSPQFDNLLTAEYSKAIETYANAALIGGEGEGTEQRTASVGDAQGIDRYETYVDGSGVSSNGEIITEEEYTALLEDYGRQQLAAVSETETISGTVDYRRPFMIDQDYALGDLVQIEVDGIRGKARVTEVIYSEAPDGITVIPTFSEWEVE